MPTEASGTETEVVVEPRDLALEVALVPVLEVELVLAPEVAAREAAPLRTSAAPPPPASRCGRRRPRRARRAKRVERRAAKRAAASRSAVEEAAAATEDDAESAAASLHSIHCPTSHTFTRYLHFKITIVILFQLLSTLLTELSFSSSSHHPLIPPFILVFILVHIPFVAFFVTFKIKPVFEQKMLLAKITRVQLLSNCFSFLRTYVLVISVLVRVCLAVAHI